MAPPRRQRAFKALVACLSLGPWAAAAVREHGVIFDAGSSGSRIHVYTWENAGASNPFELVSDDLLKKKPGLSAYKDETEKAGSSLEPLLEYAYEKIPEQERKKAPVYLMATAGLRLVGEQKKDEILQSVCKTLEASPFTFKCPWATLLSGFDEGLYGWVTVNYLMDALQASAPKSYGIIDLGGGSVQIVFEPKGKIPAAERHTLPLSHGTKTLYVKSHLGYGLDQSRGSIAAVAAKDGRHVHPCLPTGYAGKVRTSDGAEVKFEGSSDYKGCVALVESIFPTAECPVKPCSIQGAYQPPISTDAEFVGFSYMYDRTGAIGLLDGKAAVYGEQSATISQIKEAAARLCATNWHAVTRRFESNPEADKAHQFCGDAVYLHVLLERGLGFAPDTRFRMTNKIKGIELVWTLGAMLAKVHEMHSGSSTTTVVIGSIAAVILLLLYVFRQSLFRGYGLLPFRSDY